MARASESWRELTRLDDPHLARTVAVSIAAMEFPVRSILVANDEVIDWAALASDSEADSDVHGHDQPGLGALDDAGMIAIEVHPDDWPDLADILPDLIAEQAQFDEYCERRHRLAGRAQRTFLIVLIAIVAVLATIGAIRL